jgi:hypothetical protein
MWSMAAVRKHAPEAGWRNPLPEKSKYWSPAKQRLPGDHQRFDGGEVLIERRRQ